MELKEIVGLAILVSAFLVGGITLVPMIWKLYRRELSGSSDLESRILELEREVELLREDHAEDMDVLTCRMDLAERGLPERGSRADERGPIS